MEMGITGTMKASPAPCKARNARSALVRQTDRQSEIDSDLEIWTAKKVVRPSVLAIVTWRSPSSMAHEKAVLGSLLDVF
jgi:hypothetical protein